LRIEEGVKSAEEEIKLSAAATIVIAKQLFEHQLYPERQFAKEGSVQQSLARVHGRLDETATERDGCE
jgi:hypothetical protein